MENKIVVHKKDGAILKGLTHDFRPEEEQFHLLPGEGGGVPIRLRLRDLKALFYVKDYVGNRDYVARRQWDEAHQAGRRAILHFQDGEEMWGVLGEGAEGEGTGFYFFPADPRDNNIRVFVVRSALKEMRRVG
jgi:uncharacterized protein DUF6982